MPLREVPLREVHAAQGHVWDLGGATADSAFADPTLTSAVNLTFTSLQALLRRQTLATPASPGC